MKKRKIDIIILVMVVGLLWLSGCSVTKLSDGGKTLTNSSGKDASITKISLNGETLTGSYDGDILNGLPDGEGKFEIADENSDIRCLQGTFSEGVLAGEIKVEMADGTVLTGKTRAGRYQGSIKAVYPDGTYQMFQYDSGTPKGQTVIYNQENMPVGQNWYREGVLLTDLIGSAQSYPLEDLYEDPYYYSKELIKFSGTADMVCQNSTECILRISNSQRQSVFGVYEDSQYNEEFPVVVPLIEEGDTVTIYGTFEGIKENKYNFSGADYGYSFPVISVFYAEKEGYETDVFKRPQEPFSYTDILNNPYYFVGTDVKVDAVVENVLMNYEEDYVYCRSVTKEGDVYYIFLPWYKWLGKDKPLKGDRLSVLGTIAGNYIETSIDGNNDKYYKTYPLVRNVRVN